jgi:hypothetical protein
VLLYQQDPGHASRTPYVIHRLIAPRQIEQLQSHANPAHD